MIDMGVNILKEYNDIVELLKEFYENEVSFNISSFINTLRDLSDLDVDEHHKSAVYVSFEDIDNYYKDVYVAFNINEKRTRMSFEMIRIEFTVFYIDRMHSNDVKILNIDIKENYKN